MQRAFILALALGGTLFVSACQKTETPAAASSVEDGLPTKAQPKLQTAKLLIGPATLNAELALTIDQMRTGMMYRTNMAEDDAMLFVFAQPFRATFWMKNTLLPLSAAYVSPDGTVAEIHDLQPLNTNAVAAASDDIQFVIETTQGWFQRHGVSTGMVVRGENRALIDMFQFHRNP